MSASGSNSSSSEYEEELECSEGTALEAVEGPPSKKTHLLDDTSALPNRSGEEPEDSSLPGSENGQGQKRKRRRERKPTKVQSGRRMAKGFWPTWFLQTLCGHNRGVFGRTFNVSHAVLQACWMTLCDKAHELNPDIMVFENATTNQVALNKEQKFTNLVISAFPGYEADVSYCMGEEQKKTLVQALDGIFDPKTVQRGFVRLNLQFRSVSDMLNYHNISPTAGLVMYMLGGDKTAYKEVVAEWTSIIDFV